MLCKGALKVMENRRGSTKWGKRREYMFCEGKQVKTTEEKKKLAEIKIFPAEEKTHGKTGEKQ